MKIGKVIIGLIIVVIVIASLVLKDGWASRLLETKKMKQERLKIELQQSKQPK